MNLFTINTHMNKQSDYALLAETYGQIASRVQPITGKYIFFIDDNELYRVDENGSAYELVGTIGDAPKVRWNLVKVVVGEDILELAPHLLKGVTGRRDTWYVVDDSFPTGHAHKALVSTI
jgi:hypothetical protein